MLHGISSTTCHPCYPGSRWTPLPLFQRPSSGLPLQDTGSASPFSVTRLRLGSLALRPCCFALGNSRPPITRTPLPAARKAYGQLLSRDFNPLDIPPITANTQAPFPCTVKVRGDGPASPARRPSGVAAPRPKGEALPQIAATQRYLHRQSNTCSIMFRAPHPTLQALSVRGLI